MPEEAYGLTLEDICDLVGHSPGYSEIYHANNDVSTYQRCLRIAISTLTQLFKLKNSATYRKDAFVKEQYRQLAYTEVYEIDEIEEIQSLDVFLDAIQWNFSRRSTLPVVPAKNGHNGEYPY